MKINSIGTNADTKANVDISKVHGGYFADPANIEKFIEVGIEPILKDFDEEIYYVDFGGGQGHLSILVKDYLQSKNYKVTAVVADANDKYLEISKQKGLEVKFCNLEDVNFSDIDLVTMRAVLHYNTPANQKLILKNIFDALKMGRYLVHQNSSGNKENCELRSALVNIPELGRSGAGNYHWVSEKEYFQLIKDTGFSNTYIAGYANSNSWGPDEQWHRFNDKITKQANKNNDDVMLNEIETRKEGYLKKAYVLIEEYVDKYGKEYLGIKEVGNGKIMIEYVYPIVVSRK